MSPFEGRQIHANVIRVSNTGDHASATAALCLGIGRKTASTIDDEEDDDSSASSTLAASSAPVHSFLGVVVEPCEDQKASQHWLREGLFLKPAAALSLCLSVATNNSIAQTMGVSVELALCNETMAAYYPWQHWTTSAAAAAAAGLQQEEAEEASFLVNNYQQQCLAFETDAPAGRQEIWTGPLADGSTAVLLFNRGRSSVSMVVPWSTLRLSSKVTYQVRDLWAQETLPQDSLKRGIRAWDIPPHGCMFYKVTPVS